MTAPTQPVAPSAEALANRRWLIGIGVTVLFGLFGVVMALLAHWDRAPAPGAADPPAAGAPVGKPQPAPADAPAPPADGAGKGRGKGKDRK